MRSDLLHLSKTFPLPPLGSPVLEPYLQETEVFKRHVINTVYFSLFNRRCDGYLRKSNSQQENLDTDSFKKKTKTEHFCPLRARMLQNVPSEILLAVAERRIIFQHLFPLPRRIVQ